MSVYEDGVRQCTWDGEIGWELRNTDLGGYLKEGKREIREYLLKSKRF